MSAVIQRSTLAAIIVSALIVSVAANAQTMQTAPSPGSAAGGHSHSPADAKTTAGAMEHDEHHKMMHAQHHPTGVDGAGANLTMPGQDAFGAIAEVVRKL